jgi:hypothetical protein
LNSSLDMDLEELEEYFSTWFWGGLTTLFKASLLNFHPTPIHTHTLIRKTGFQGKAKTSSIVYFHRMEKFLLKFVTSILWLKSFCRRSKSPLDWLKSTRSSLIICNFWPGLFLDNLC